MEIKKASVKDIELLIKLRLDYLADTKSPLPPADQALLRLKLTDYFNRWLNNGFIAFYAEDNGEVLSAAFLSIVERPPRAAHTSCLVGTVYNVFTYAGHRRKGYAACVLTALLEEANRLDVASVDLLATPDGRPLYEKLGFQIAGYTPMRKKLN